MNAQRFEKGTNMSNRMMSSMGSSVATSDFNEVYKQLLDKKIAQNKAMYD